LPYVEFHGEAGDIIFWHHRLAHAGGHNRTWQIRQAVFYDFVKDDLEEKMNMPPAKDMWEDWSEEVRSYS
jgi:ectoine hydroxylase-related dioxygenase (phytanoyl-CoA dioxygenase family)